jgi:hypothetical protein
MLSRLKSRAQRFFAALLFLFLAIAVAVAYRTETVIAPSQWYFFTADGGQIDIRSPNRRLIIDADIYPQPSWPAYALKRAEFSARCDLQRRQTPVNPVGAAYRGVELCNTISATGDEFEIRNSYFRSRVDSLYLRYYHELAEHYATPIGAAFALWLTLLAGWGMLRWIIRR